MGDDAAIRPPCVTAHDSMRRNSVHVPRDAAHRARSREDVPARPQPASTRGRQRQPSVSTIATRAAAWRLLQQRRVRRHVRVKVRVRVSSRRGRAVEATGRRAPERARARAEKRRSLTELGHRLVVIERGHRLDVVVQQLCEPCDKSRISQHISSDNGAQRRKAQCWYKKGFKEAAAEHARTCSPL